MALFRFSCLVHADWSASPAKRWAAEAYRTETGWSVEAPRLVGPVDRFVSQLLRGAQSSLVGFDFPIGVPAIFGRMTKFNEFREAVEQFGVGLWSQFFQVCERAGDISLPRPFYPYKPGGKRQVHLLAGLEAEHMDALRRQCERATGGRSAACPLFWTLGPNQVGKAAISGWREVLQPVLRMGARLWPFEGDLSSLAERGRLVICETYPREAYGHVGVRFRSGGSKRRQEDRREATGKLATRCVDHGISLTSEMKADLADGFGSKSDGEDRFDATMGLLSMIEVVQGRRAEAPVTTEAIEWEGWILGQASQ